MSSSFHACLIAGTHSGVGKTTWAGALMALARKKGLTVQPFKVGPDYIDPGFHHQVCAPRKSRNLDLFLLPYPRVQEIFSRHASGADLVVVEGVMGLFDGRAVKGEEASTAQVAKLLGLPVFLVIDGSALATSAAALVLGFKEYDPALKLAGIFVNRVSSERHFVWIREAVEARCVVPCLGYLPPEDSIRIPERHLGLMTAAETQGGVARVEEAVRLLESRLDWDRFWAASALPSLRGREAPEAIYTSEIAETVPSPEIVRQKDRRIRPDGFADVLWRTSPPSAARPPEDGSAVFVADNDGRGISPPRNDSPPACRIGVAYDAAFSFYYEDNLDWLREAGAELVFFSPLADARLPVGLDLLYFGGGFPEIHVTRLSQNQSLADSIRTFYKEGGAIYAECGGLMYLAESLRRADSKEFPLVGLLPGHIRMTARLQNFGYHECETLADTFLFPRAKTLRSHEFHYSLWSEEGRAPAAYRLGDRREGFVGERIVASYQHLHFGSDPQMAVRLVEHLKRPPPLVMYERNL